MSGTNMRFIGAVLLMGILGACGGAESTPRSGNPIEAPPIIEKVGEYSINDGSDVLDLTDAPAGSIGYRLGKLKISIDRVSDSSLMPVNPGFFTMPRMEVSGPMWMDLESSAGTMMPGQVGIQPCSKILTWKYGRPCPKSLPIAYLKR